MGIASIIQLVILSIVTLGLIALLFYFRLISTKHIKGLNSWIYAFILSFIGLLIVTFGLNLKEGQIKLVFTVLGYSTFITGSFLTTYSFSTIVNKIKYKYYIGPTYFITIVLMLLSSFIFRSDTMFTIVTLGMYVITLLASLYILIRNKDMIQKRQWFLHSAISVIVLVVLAIFLLDKVLLRNNQLNILYNTRFSLMISLFIANIISSLGVVKVLVSDTLYDKYNLRSMFEHVSEFTTTIDLILNYDDEVIKFANKLFYQKFNYTKDETINLLSFRALFIDLNIYKSIIFELEHTTEVLEYYVKLKRKEMKPIETLIAIKRIIVKGRNYYAVSIQDITETVNTKNKFERLSLYDELTLLPNRRRVKEVFNTNLKLNNDFVVLLLDVDNFKIINDTYGHLIGDEFLKIIAKRFNFFNRGNNIVSRYGGDEFVFILNYESEAVLDGAIYRIMSYFKEPFTIKGITFKATVSIGGSFYPKDGKNFGTLMDKADDALYKSKNVKGNHIEYYGEDKKTINVKKYEVV